MNNIEKSKPMSLTSYQKKIMKMKDVYMICVCLNDKGSFCVARYWRRGWHFPKRWCYTYEDALMECSIQNKSRKYNEDEYIKSQFGTDFLEWVNNNANHMGGNMYWMFQEDGGSKNYTTHELYFEYKRIQEQLEDSGSGVVPSELPPSALDTLYTELKEGKQ